MEKKLYSKAPTYVVSLLGGLYEIRINSNYVDQCGRKVAKYGCMDGSDFEPTFIKVSDVKIYEFPYDLPTRRVVSIHDKDVAKTIAKYLMRAFDISLEEMEQELKEKGKGEWEGQ